MIPRCMSDESLMVGTFFYSITIMSRIETIHDLQIRTKTTGDTQQTNEMGNICYKM